MTPEIAKKALEFMQRVDLKGIEVPDFIEVANALSEIVNGFEVEVTEE